MAVQFVRGFGADESSWGVRSPTRTSGKVVDDAQRKHARLNPSPEVDEKRSASIAHAPGVGGNGFGRFNTCTHPTGTETHFSTAAKYLKTSSSRMVSAMSTSPQNPHALSQACMETRRSRHGGKTPLELPWQRCDEILGPSGPANTPKDGLQRQRATCVLDIGPFERL